MYFNFTVLTTSVDNKIVIIGVLYLFFYDLTFQVANIFSNASLMTMEYVQILVNCRSTLGLLAGMMNPEGFL